MGTFSTTNGNGNGLATHSPLMQNTKDEPLPNLLAIFWRRRWIVLTFTLLGVVFAYINLRRAIPTFESSCVLYVHQSTPRIISDAVVSSEAANLYTQCELIKSTANLSGALEQPGVADAKMLRGVENPAALLKSLITAEPEKQGDLLKVSIIASNPLDAALVLNSVVKSYIDYQNKQQKSTSSEVLKILEREKDRYEGLLKVTSEGMVQFKKDNPEMALSTEHGNVITDRFAALSDALTHAQFQTLDLELENDEIAAMKNDPVQLKQYIATMQVQGKFSASEQPSSSQAQLGALLLQQRQLSEKLGPADPQLMDLERNIADLQQIVVEEERTSLSKFVAVAAFNLKQAKLREDELSRQVEKERTAAMNLNFKSAQFDQMVGEGRRDERMLDTLDNRIKELNVTEDAGGSGGLNVSILETAKPDFTPVSPKPTQILGTGLMAGILLGCGCGLLRDFLDQRLRSAEEIGRVLDLPILGTVPHMTVKGSSPERGQQVHLKPRSDVAEAYRTIRTAIYFGVPEEHGKTILITSPAPGDGKSTMASNLAIAIAQAGRRVLLIDADCRRPTQHKNFEIEAEVGLSTVLLGRTRFADAVHNTSTEHLDILPCGPLPTNPSELLNSQAFIDLLTEVGAKYDNIIIDSAPVVPVTDARILAASCDVTILVLRAEKSTRNMTRHACDALGSVGAHLLGVVVNDVSRRKASSYYYYNGYGYRYGYSSNNKANGTVKEVKAITVTSRALQSSALPMEEPNNSGT